METKTMATTVQGGSATIYQFPPRGRYAVGANNAAEQVSAAPAHIVFGSGWYHDEAIEAERTRKN